MKHKQGSKTNKETSICRNKFYGEVVGCKTM